MAESEQQTSDQSSFLGVVRSVILTGIGVLFNLPHFFEEEAKRATPRRVAITLFTASVIGVFAALILSIVGDVLILNSLLSGTHSGFAVKIVSPVTSAISRFIVNPVFQSLVTAVALVGGYRLSYWWIARHSGNAEMLPHCQLVLIAWLPLQLFTAISITIGWKILEANVVLQWQPETLLTSVWSAYLLFALSLALLAYGYVLISRALRAIYDLDSRTIRNGALIVLLTPIVLDAILSLDWLTTLRLLRIL